MKKILKARDGYNVGGMQVLDIPIVIVAFEIFNTVLMCMTEPFRAFGIQLSVGIPQASVIALGRCDTMCITRIGFIMEDVILNGKCVSNSLYN